MRKTFFIVIWLAAAAHGANLGTGVGLPGPGATWPAGQDGLGSIISSFYVSGISGSYPLGIYRDANYVYLFFYNPNHLRVYTPTGSLVSSYPLPGSVPRGADYCHLSPGYLCWVDAGTYYVYIATTTGSTVQSFSYSVGGWAIDIAWTGAPDQYYLVGNYTGGPASPFYRYTSTGSLAGTWTASGWPAGMTYRGSWTIANAINNTAGRYLVASSWSSGQPSCVIVYPSGSLIGTWVMPSSNANGGCYGEGFPSGTYGPSYWVLWYTGTAMWVMQVDLGNQPSFNAVVPRSLGEIKAIFR